MIGNIYLDFIAKDLSISKWQVEHCINLFEEGATIPFISRYRKEKTGGLDETKVGEIKFHFLKFEELEKRKEFILKSIEDQGKLTEELKALIEETISPEVLEDIYLPYKKKRKTRATIAKEKGLEPLAELIFNCKVFNPEEEAEKYVSDEVDGVNQALLGARDIMAEWISEVLPIREQLRKNYIKYGKVAVKLAKGKDADAEESLKYKNYYDFSENIDKAPSHRVLAMLRGASEGVLSIKINIDSGPILDRMYNKILDGKPDPSDAVALEIDYALEDSFKRLLHPSIENETLKTAKERADIESIRVFGENLRQLLMAPPLGNKRILALDPGFRTGCKLVCLSAEGELLHNDTIYPHPPVNEKTIAMKKISNLLQAYKIEIIAIGNGTAGRETEAFIKKMALPNGVKVFSVNEDGASIYSASPVAREEFPDYDVTVRGAVSIGRRIMDPLAELVKIDPKSLGVGQYQHDVDQALLRQRLDNIVESCVNTVGVNLNTASKHLLSYVSGIGPTLAQNIVEYRSDNGSFTSRSQLLKVKRLGDKVFEQCAAFLRIPNATNPLDNSSVHPERYSLVEQISKDLGVGVCDLINEPNLRNSISLDKYVSPEVGLPTLNDIILELAKPGRDPRSSIKVFEFADDIRIMEDLKIGMELPGIVTNITNFGAFVDIGIKQNGLIHVSHLADKFVSNPADIVKLHQHIKVRVIDVDTKRERIALKLI